MGAARRPPGRPGYDIRYKFDDPNTWYVTDANSGVHISYDNGLTWVEATRVSKASPASPTTPSASSASQSTPMTRTLSGSAPSTRGTSTARPTAA